MTWDPIQAILIRWREASNFQKNMYRAIPLPDNSTRTISKSWRYIYCSPTRTISSHRFEDRMITAIDYGEGQHILIRAMSEALSALAPSHRLILERCAEHSTSDQQIDWRGEAERWAEEKYGKAGHPIPSRIYTARHRRRRETMMVYGEAMTIFRSFLGGLLEI